MSNALQRERTQLSWERTAFSFMAVGILLGFRSGKRWCRGTGFSRSSRCSRPRRQPSSAAVGWATLVPPSHRHRGPSR